MKILLLGCSTRSLAECARMDERVEAIYSIDCFADRDTCEAADVVFSMAGGLTLRECLAKIPRYDAVCYSSVLGSDPSFLSFLQGAPEILGNGPLVLSALNDQWRLFQMLKLQGVAVPKALFPGERIPGERYLIKRCGLEGGAGINWGIKGQIVPNGSIGQGYVTGTPCSCAFVSDGKKWGWLGHSEQIIGWPLFFGGGFRYGGNLIAPGDRLKPAEKAQVEKMIAVLVETYGLKGLNGIDFILDDEGVAWFLEINPRFTAAMELYARKNGTELFQLHVSGCRGELRGDRIQGIGNEKWNGKAILYGWKDLIIPESRWWEGKDVGDIPGSGERIQEENPVCTLYAEGKSRVDCVENLCLLRDDVMQILDRKEKG